MPPLLDDYISVINEEIGPACHLDENDAQYFGRYCRAFISFPVLFFDQREIGVRGIVSVDFMEVVTDKVVYQNHIHQKVQVHTAHLLSRLSEILTSRRVEENINSYCRSS